MYVWILRTSTRLALASSRRDLDAPERASEDPDPKTRMLGPTPSILLELRGFEW